MLELVVFYFLVAVMLIAGIAAITQRHPLPAALLVIVSFLGLAGLYAMLTAQLIAILQILVYAGAIVALIVFVIMLLNVQPEDLDYHEQLIPQLGGAALVALPVLALIITAVGRLPAGAFPPVAPTYGTIQEVGLFLYRNYMFVFELVSVLLTVALAGVVLLAKRRV